MACSREGCGHEGEKAKVIDRSVSSFVGELKLGVVGMRKVGMHSRVQQAHGGRVQWRRRRWWWRAGARCSLKVVGDQTYFFG
jgi:hypothetical protein